MEDLARNVSVSVEEITDPKQLQEEKDIFFRKAAAAVEAHLPSVSISEKRHLAGLLLHRMFGMGEMEMLLSDNWLEEIAINGSRAPVSVFHKRFGWLQTTQFLPDDVEIYNLASKIGRKVGRQINSLSPIMDAHLLTGDRVSATLFPISTQGNTITIRRFSRNPWTIIHMIDPKIRTMSIEMAAFLWLAMQYELNILVAGGTASGKTSVLNSLCALIPPSQRIISIEDTREISLPQALHWNWVPLNTRNATSDGEGEITMLDLLTSSLRMRPDRLVVGEVRTDKQAQTMFEAMHTGHSAYATIHADTVAQVKRRLIEAPMSIPSTQAESLQLVLAQYRDRRTGARRSLELAEVMRGSKDKDIEFNYLYRWHPRGDAFEQIDDSMRVVEDLNLHTGFTAQEISQDLLEKIQILRWMYKQKVRDVDEIGKVMSMYYTSPSVIVNAARFMKDAKRFLVRAEDDLASPRIRGGSGCGSSAASKVSVRGQGLLSRVRDAQRKKSRR
jgi:flagellar protein FlaI